jgi:hypothetical protein
LSTATVTDDGASVVLVVVGGNVVAVVLVTEGAVVVEVPSRAVVVGPERAAAGLAGEVGMRASTTTATTKARATIASARNGWTAPERPRAGRLPPGPEGGGGGTDDVGSDI